MAFAVDLFRCFWKKTCSESTTKWKPQLDGFVPLNREKVIL